MFNLVKQTVVHITREICKDGEKKKYVDLRNRVIMLNYNGKETGCVGGCVRSRGGDSAKLQIVKGGK